MKPCILIPIYDHGATIADVVASLEPLKLPCLIIDDGSGPETRRALEEICRRWRWVRIQRRDRNGGRGAALETGYRMAARLGFTHVIQMDADGQHLARDAQAALDQARRHPTAAVLGHPIFDESAPRLRRAGHAFTRFWIRLETWSSSIRDPLCGLRGLPLAAVLKILDRHDCGDGMAFDIALAVRLEWDDVPIVNLPVDIAYPEGGVSHFGMFRDNFHISALHSRLLLEMLLKVPRLARRTHGPRSREAWWTRPERGSMWALDLSLWLYRHLGRNVARALLHPVIGYFLLTDPDGRRASAAYLQRVYAQGGRLAGKAAPGLRDVYRHYLAFGINVLDRIGFWLGDGSEFSLRVRGEEHLTQIVAEGRGALVLGSHLGSFEALRLLASKDSPLRVNVLMYTAHAKRINRLLSRLGGPQQSQRGFRIIPIHLDSFHHIFEARACLKRGEVVAILADRLPPMGQTGKVGNRAARRTAHVKFLGDTAVFPPGPIILAHLLECPVVFMAALRVGEMSYDVTVESFSDRVTLPRAEREEAIRNYCQRFANRLGHHCLCRPYQWFNFFDFWNQDALDVRR